MAEHGELGAMALARVSASEQGIGRGGSGGARSIRIESNYRCVRRWEMELENFEGDAGAAKFGWQSRPTYQAPLSSVPLVAEKWGHMSAAVGSAQTAATVRWGGSAWGRWLLQDAGCSNFKFTKDIVARTRDALFGPLGPLSVMWAIRSELPNFIAPALLGLVTDAMVTRSRTYSILVFHATFSFMCG
jgi:hypothetical protein